MDLSRLLPVMIFLAAGALYSIKAGKLTAPAALMGVLLAFAVCLVTPAVAQPADPLPRCRQTVHRGAVIYA